MTARTGKDLAPRIAATDGRSICKQLTVCVVAADRLIFRAADASDNLGAHTISIPDLLAVPDSINQGQRGRCCAFKRNSLAIVDPGVDPAGALARSESEVAAQGGGTGFAVAPVASRGLDRTGDKREVR